MYIYFNVTQGDIFSYEMDPYTDEYDYIKLAYNTKNNPLKYKKNKEDLLWDIYYA